MQQFLTDTAYVLGFAVAAVGIMAALYGLVMLVRRILPGRRAAPKAPGAPGAPDTPPPARRAG